MAIADVLAVATLLAVASIGLPVLLALLTLCAPETVERATQRVATAPWGSLATGLAVFISTMLVAVVMGRILAGPGRLLGVIVLLASASVGTIGAAGLARFLGSAWRGQARLPARMPEAFLGGVLLEFAAAVPIVGWLVALPAFLLISLGAGAHALRRPRIVQTTAACQPQV